MSSTGVVKLWQAACRYQAAHRHDLVAVGALLTCFAVVLNVGPFTPGPRPHGVRAHAEQPIGTNPTAADIGTDRDPQRLQTERPYAFEPIGPSIDVSSALMKLSSLSAVGPTRPAFRPVGPNDGEGDIQPRPTRQEFVSPEPGEQAHATIVGIWAPDASTCSARNFREGLLPAIINTDGAWAGETFCTFKNQKQTDTDWRVVASCSNPREQWTANVRLTVKGNRLIWTSKRGTQAYTRCAPNVLMAEVR